MSPRVRVQRTPKRAKDHFALQTAHSTGTPPEGTPKRAKCPFALQTDSHPAPRQRRTEEKSVRQETGLALAVDFVMAADVEQDYFFVRDLDRENDAIVVIDPDRLELL